MKKTDKLLGIILITAVIGIFAACGDGPKSTCVCETPHYLTCGDYSCEATHSHSQAVFHTLGGINVYVTAGVSTDGLKEKLDDAWNSGGARNNIIGNVNRINITNTGDAASISGNTITINGGETVAVGVIASALNAINTSLANAQSNDNVKMANGIQKINFCI